MHLSDGAASRVAVFCIRQWNFGFHKMTVVSWPAEWLPTAHKTLCHSECANLMQPFVLCSWTEVSVRTSHANQEEAVLTFWHAAWSFSSRVVQEVEVILSCRRVRQSYVGYCEVTRRQKHQEQRPKTVRHIMNTSLRHEHSRKTQLHTPTARKRKMFRFGEDFHVQGALSFSEQSVNWKSNSVTSEGLADSWLPLS